MLWALYWLWYYDFSQCAFNTILPIHRKQTMFIKFFEYGFEPNETAITISEIIYSKYGGRYDCNKKIWGLTDGQIAFFQWLIIRELRYKWEKGRMNEW